ncbi:helix-turn-helix transcriptional regulator [Terrabacter tumescens]|uniref:helix-turn-helix transcriptional regulator n=1 Tax=Terrabacter tumescens TaxID=60443 RepID=UPI0012DE193A|nr:transcriptional regulator [Terrabacter tumescens]
MKNTPGPRPTPNRAGTKGSAAPVDAVDAVDAVDGVRGPVPLPELATARRRVLAAVADREVAGGATTVGDLAADLGGHPNSTRAHLGRLVAEGLLERVPQVAGTRGRPAHGHRLTPRGRLVLEAVQVAEPVATDELVAAMAEHLSTTPDAEIHARAIGRLWASQLAHGPASRPARGAPSAPAGAPSPVERVTTLLRTAGFSPERDPSGDVALRTCPVLASARAHPGVVCTMHEEMLRAALDDAGTTDVEVELAPFAREGACLVHLRRR